MPADYCLMHVGYWVNDLAAISCLGAGLAAIVLTLLPGKRLTGKTDASDPSAFIDPGAGETARYRLAYGDLVTVKNSGVDVTQITGKAPQSADGSEGTRVQSASELAMTMFDQGVLGVGMGAMSQEATKAISKTRVEKAKPDSKTRIDKEAKLDSKTKVDTKTKVEPKAKPEKKPDKKAGSKKGDVAQLDNNMAVRKITYGHKKFEQKKEGEAEPEVVEETSVEETFIEAAKAPASDMPELSFFKDEVVAAFTVLPDEPSQSPPTGSGGFPVQVSAPPALPVQENPLPPGFPMQTNQPPGFPAPTNQPPGFPVQTNQPPGFPVQTNQPPGFPVQTNQPPGFPVQTNQPPGFPAQTNQPPGIPAQTNQPPAQPGEQQNQPEPPEIDPKKDPKKIGRSTLIEPKRNLQGDKEPPPPEYFK